MQRHTFSFLLCIAFTSLSLSFPAVAVKVFHVNDFGATPNDDSDDDREAIQDALNCAIDYKNGFKKYGYCDVSGVPGDVRVDFGPGIYHLKSVVTGSNNPAHQILRVWDAGHSDSKLTLHGGGSKLISKIWNSETIAFKNNKNVTFQNFVFDINPLPYVDGTVTSVHKRSNSVIIKLVRGMNPMLWNHHGNPSPNVIPTETVWTYDQNSPNAFGWLLDPVVAGRPKAGSSNHFRASKVESLGNNFFRFTISTGDINDFAVNDRFTFHMRIGHNIRVNGSGSHYVFKNITSYASNAFMIAVDGSSIQYVNFDNIKAKIRSDRWRSLNGDGIHVNYSDGITIANSEFYGLSDDAINFNGATNWAVSNTIMENKRRHGILVMGGAEFGTITGNTARYNGGSFFVNESGATHVILSNNIDSQNNLTN